MNRIFLVLLWCLLPMVAHALPVVVKSGEHDGFTRLVMDFGAPVDWTVGRSIDGYVLHIVGPAATYDLTEAFALIGKGRLAALWVDPVSNDLQMGIACACHALPFEFRPGIVVVDLKDGSPPRGSSFELSLEGTKTLALSGRTAPNPRPRPRPTAMLAGYDWLKTPVNQMDPPQSREDMAAVLSDPQMEPMRESLLWQMSKGAAEGVVDMTLPANKKEEPEIAHDMAAEVRFGDETSRNLSTSSDKLAAQGQLCIVNEALDIASWGSDLPIADQLADRVDGLVREFDRPDPEAIAKAVRLNLFLGFGAEARQLLTVFPVEAENRAIWSSLASLLDDEPDKASVFVGLAACDTAAALWAVLSESDLSQGDLVNAPAVLLAFSRLPLHLRKQLSPRLADRFLAMNDQSSAGAVRDAVMRAPGQEGSTMVLVQASIDLHRSDAKAAEIALAQVLTDPGSATPEVLISYVEARVAQDLPVKTELVPALAGLLRETPDGVNKQRMARALALAQAASGDFDAAFAGAVLNPELGTDLWRMLAKLGTDTDVLTYAILPVGTSVTTVDDATSQLLATRLLEMGFSKPAAVWSDNLKDANPMLAAKVALGQNDPRAALRLLAGANSLEATSLRRAALVRLGDEVALAEAYAQGGDSAAQSVALGRAGDWERLVDLGEGPWQALAATLKTPPQPADTGPLATARRLTEVSDQTRTAVTALLADVPMPASR